MIEVRTGAGMLMHVLAEADCTPFRDAPRDILLTMHWVAAGKAITENAVCTFASLLVLPLPISTIQDIIENGGCHAAMVSGEVCFGDSHGIVLQVIAAFACPGTSGLFAHLPCKLQGIC